MTSYHRLQSWITLRVGHVVHFQIKFNVSPSRHSEDRTESNFSYTGVRDITEPEVTYLVSLNSPSRSATLPPAHLSAPFPNPVTSYNRKWRHHWETWITAWVVVYPHIQFDSNPSSRLEARTKGIPIPMTSYNRKWRHRGKSWITPWVVIYFHIQFHRNQSSCLEARTKSILTICDSRVVT